MIKDVKKISEVENPLFSRREFHFEFYSEAVPSYEEVKNTLKEKFSINTDLARVKKISGKFGVQVFDVYVDVYSSAEEFKRVVKKTKQEIEAEKKAVEEKKKAEAEAKKAAEETKKAAEESKKAEAEKPAEAPVEEKPVEEKPAEESSEEVKEEVKTAEVKAEESK